MKNRYRYLMMAACLFITSSPLQSQWAAINTGMPSMNSAMALAVSGTNVYAGTSSGVFRFNENTVSWTAINGALPEYTIVTSLVVSGANIFAGTYRGTIFRSTDNGSSWTAVQIYGTNSWITFITVSDTILFTWIRDLTGGGTLLRSTDNGTSWTPAMNGLPNAEIAGFTSFGTNLFACSVGHGVFRSTDNGTSWTRVNGDVSMRFVTALGNAGPHLLVGTLFHGMFYSNSDDTTWHSITTGWPPTYISAFAAYGNLVFAGTHHYEKGSLQALGVFRSSDNGMSWTAVNEGLPLGSDAASIECLAIAGKYIFAGTSVGVYRRQLAEMIMSVERRADELPVTRSLEQNYPNPFNPATTIRYQLPARSHMSLTVFNTLGQRVSVLQDGEQEAGFHEVKFDGKGLTSGVYFYRMQAGEFVQTKQLIIVK